MTDQQYAALEKMAPYMGIVLGAATAIVGPLITLVLAAVLFGVFTALMGGNATFKQVFSVVVHCGAVSVVGQILTVILNFFRQSMNSATNLAVLLPMLDERGFLAKFLGMIDLFLVWWVFVLAIGMSVLYRRKTRPIALSFFGIYGVIAVVFAAYQAMRSGS